MFMCRDGGSEGVKLWGVDMSRSRSFSIGDHAGVVRSVCRSKVSAVCHVMWSCDVHHHVMWSCDVLRVGEDCGGDTEQ